MPPDPQVARGDPGDEKGGAARRRVFFSNEEYYSKLEELKKAHLRTMAELESMYRRKLRLRVSAAPDAPRQQRGSVAFGPWRRGRAGTDGG